MSRQRHLIDYVIVLQHDLQDAMTTRSMRGAGYWSGLERSSIDTSLRLDATDQKSSEQSTPLQRNSRNSIWSKGAGTLRLVFDENDENDGYLMRMTKTSLTP